MTRYRPLLCGSEQLGMVTSNARKSGRASALAMGESPPSSSSSSSFFSSSSTCSAVFSPTHLEIAVIAGSLKNMKVTYSTYRAMSAIASESTICPSLRT